MKGTEWWTVARIAEELGMSERAVMRDIIELVYEGAIAKNGEWLVPKDEVVKKFLGSLNTARPPAGSCRRGRSHLPLVRMYRGVRYLSLTEASQRLGVTYQTVLKKCKNGRFSTHQLIDRHHYVREEEVEQTLLNRMAAPELCVTQATEVEHDTYEEQGVTATMTLEEWQDELLRAEGEFFDEYLPCVDDIVHRSGVLGLAEDDAFRIDGFLGQLSHEFVRKMFRIRPPEPEVVDGTAQLRLVLPLTFVDGNGEPRIAEACFTICESGTSVISITCEADAVPPTKQEFFAILVAAMNSELLRTAYEMTGGYPLND